jgi:diacylglycerol kinase (ATP)
MKQDLRTFVVANPRARAGAVGREWSPIERMLKAKISEIDVAFTEGPGHATVLAREALRSGWEMILCVGGDGTCNEIAGGFFEEPESQVRFEIDEEGWLKPLGPPPSPINPDAVFGFLPLGTGGDLRRTLGWMGSIKENIQRLDGRKTKPIDVGYVGFVDPQGQVKSRVFVNIASAGFSGAVDALVNRMWKGLGGNLSFRLASLGAFVGWKNPEVTVQLDNLEEHRGKFFNVVVANGQYFGSGMWIAPGAALDDGAFQVVFLGDLGLPRVLQLMGAIYQGGHLGFDEVFRRNATEISIRPESHQRRVALDLDGEQPGHLPAHFSLLESKLLLKV